MTLNFLDIEAKTTSKLGIKRHMYHNLQVVQRLSFSSENYF